MTPDCVVYGFPEYAVAAERLAVASGASCAMVEIHHFPDGESRVTVPLPAARHAIFCRSLNDPNDKVIELLLASQTAREHGAERITLVAPYFCYMRQDTAFRPGQAVSQRVIGSMFATAFDEVVAVDPHLHRVSSFSVAVPAGRSVAVSATAMMGRHIAANMGAPVVIGPDAESEQWVTQIADPSGFEYAVGIKQRKGDRDVSITFPPVDLKGREVVLVDDVASTGETLLVAAREILAKEPMELTVFVVHPLFVEDALERLLAAGVNRVWSTDTLLHSTNVVCLADTLARALKA